MVTISHDQVALILYKNDLLNAATCLQWLKILVPYRQALFLLHSFLAALLPNIPIRLPCAFYISMHLWYEYFAGTSKWMWYNQ